MFGEFSENVTDGWCTIFASRFLEGVMIVSYLRQSALIGAAVELRLA